MDESYLISDPDGDATEEATVVDRGYDYLETQARARAQSTADVAACDCVVRAQADNNEHAHPVLVRSGEHGNHSHARMN
jgi:hypothetical protein